MEDSKRDTAFQKLLLTFGLVSPECRNAISRLAKFESENKGQFYTRMLLNIIRDELVRTQRGEPNQQTQPSRLPDPTNPCEEEWNWLLPYCDGNRFGEFQAKWLEPALETHWQQAYLDCLMESLPAEQASELSVKLIEIIMKFDLPSLPMLFGVNVRKMREVLAAKEGEHSQAIKDEKVLADKAMEEKAKEVSDLYRNQHSTQFGSNFLDNLLKVLDLALKNCDSGTTSQLTNAGPATCKYEDWEKWVFAKRGHLSDKKMASEIGKSPSTANAIKKKFQK